MKGQKQTGRQKSRGSNSGYRYVTGSPDRHGKIRWRFYRRGHPSCYLPDPTSPNFEGAYIKALESKPKRHTRPQDSFDAAIDRYLQSKAFDDLGASTQANYRRRLGHMGRDYGEYSIKTLRRANLTAILETITTASERNRTLSLFNIVLQCSLEAGIIEHNVAGTIRRAKQKTQGYAIWSKVEIKAYLDFHKNNETATLALLLLYYTGQRSSDVAVMGTHTVKDGRIILIQEKTKNAIDIPIHPELAKVLPDGGETWLLTAYGKPFSVKGFQQRFVKWAIAAGIKGKSAHGLRKALATHLAEGGATAHEIAAVTGHKTLAEVQRYSDNANLKNLADRAFSKLD